jgi:hypothetical protein
MYVKSTKSQLYHLKPSYSHRVLSEYVRSLVFQVVLFKSVIILATDGTRIQKV